MVAAIIVVSCYSIFVLTWGPKLLVGGLDSVLPFATVVVFHIMYFGILAVPGNWRPVSEECNLEEGPVTSSDGIGPETFNPTWSSLDGQERRPTISYCIQCQNGSHHVVIIALFAKDVFLRWTATAYG